MSALCFYFPLSILPGILWMLYIYKSDKFEPEPIKLVLKVFVGGMLIVFVAIPVELGVPYLLGCQGTLTNFLDVFWQAYFVAGVVEEFLKFAVVLFGVYFSKDFSEPVDGIVYSSAVALGFASLENFLYMLQYGASVILVRGTLSTVGHLVFSSFWGYGLGRGKMHPKIANKLALQGLLWSAVTHGTFNFLLMSRIFAGEEAGSLLASIVIPFTAFLWRILAGKIRSAEKISPYNPNKDKDDLNDFNELAGM